MRRVFKDSSECLHVWASQSQDEGRAGNVFFVGATCYSYGHHFPMATIVRNTRGDVAALFTTSSYSMTTSRHLSEARSAVSHLPRFKVDRMYLESATHGGAAQHKATEASYRAAVEAHLLKGARARFRADAYLDAALEDARTFNAYAEFYSIKARIELDAASVRQLTERALATDKAHKAAAASKLKADRARWAIDLESWRKGEDVAHVYGWQNLPTALRVVGDEIQTSRGARVPVSVARGLWDLVNLARDSNRAHTLAGHPIMVGPYALTSISANGDLKIGCHDIAYAELERMARTLGLIALV